MDSTLKVGVLMPAFNAEHHIGDAIESILNQTYSHFELFIIDDGSTDQTNQITKDYQEKDNRVVVHKNKVNQGLIRTLSNGINLLKDKDYIIRMDADDISLPNRIEQQVLYMESNKEVVVSGTWMYYFGEVNRAVELPVSNDELKVECLFRTPLFHPTIILRNAILKKYNLNYFLPRSINSNLYVWPEDYALWYELSKVGKIKNLDRYLLYYRVGKQNISYRERDKEKNRYLNIYHYIFEDLGLILSVKQIRVHYELFHGGAINYPLVDYKNWVVELINWNKKVKHFNENLLIQYLEKVWDNFFYFLCDTSPLKAIRYLILERNNEMVKIKYLLKNRISSFVSHFS